MGAVQLQSAVAAVVCRAVRVQLVSVRHSDQQPGHDRRADGQPGAGQAADRSRCSKPSWRELAAAAEDLDPILHSFKNAQQLRVGVRDILGKEDIQATTGALSDIALACLRRITLQRISTSWPAKLGEPMIAAGDECGGESRNSSFWRWANSAAGS